MATVHNDIDLAHDPGVEEARRRAESVAKRESRIIEAPDGGSIRIGTASWTDPTLTAPGVFYPAGAKSAEARLRYYADVFPLVEVDSTYYALPARRMAELWVERTPDDFIFNVKAFALMTGQPTEVARLPQEIRSALPLDAARARRIYAKDLPPELVDRVWTTFTDALAPLHAAGKLGAVLLQYPRWFTPNRANVAALIDAKERLGELPAAVEFRSGLWFKDPRYTDRTLGILREHRLPFVIVDEPQGMRSSVPPIVAVTSPALAMLRMHGHRADRWEAPNIPAVERFRYLYSTRELEGWTARVAEAAAEAQETHVLFNNCYGNYGTTNALEFRSLLSRVVDSGTTAR